MTLGKWIGLLAFVASLYILWQIRQVLLLAFAAMLLATALNRLARLLERKLKLQRWLAAGISVTLMILIIISFFLVIVPPIAKQFQELVTLVPQGINKLNEWINLLQQRLDIDLLQQIPKIDINEAIKQVQPILNQVVGGAGAFVGTTLGAVLSFLLVIVLTLMFLANPSGYRQALLILFPSFYRRRADYILNECEESLGHWIEGAMISMAVVALLSFIGLSILGVPLALSQAVLAGLLNFIPNIGPTLSVFLPMAIALLQSPVTSGLVLLLYIGIQQFESNFLTPYIMSQQVSLLPAMTLIAQVFFTTCFGFLGLLLAIPLTVVCQVWIRELLINDIMNQWENNQSVPLSSNPRNYTLAAENISLPPQVDNIQDISTLPTPSSDQSNQVKDHDINQGE